MMARSTVTSTYTLRVLPILFYQIIQAVREMTDILSGVIKLANVIAFLGSAPAKGIFEIFF